ncbi:GntR family transcriptional regulator [Oceanibacterium hippocampi]|uniref:Putative HTH-type transcriptional regulator YdfH n=1 Tax=Oceanibacterium hippocampi TaxID=745714 RepID=A0A1Y5TLT4_9PROT|nr:GntR family transcriptional regulator [Oceanibacterium hippocampi]SLN65139.1 putative HTH-type transcriptional regulator YdfH [Oceanibacterium hippocampi]
MRQSEASRAGAGRAPVGAAQSPSQTQRALVALREMIVSNRLPPGSSYLESELAEMLDMSRTPVREAAVMLEAQGLVEIRPRRGVRILPLSTQDMTEIYEILTELEGLAAQQAAARKLSKKEIANVEGALNEMDAALATDDRDRWAAADKRFHDLLVAMSGNRRLQALVESYNDQVHRARMLTVHLRPSPTRSNSDHKALFEAIVAGDQKRARALHTAHRKEAMHLIIDLLQKHGFHQV